jgi:thiol-disulfide isomerase/thioredoxin
MKQLKIIILSFIVLSALSIGSCSKENKEAKNTDSQNSSSTNEVQRTKANVYQLISSENPVGKKAGDFVWEQDGKQVRFSEYTKGKFVLLNFWGTWCPPCRRELPDLVSVAKEMESKGLVVIGAALERTQSKDEALEIVSKFWVSNQLYYPIIIASGELANAYGGINAVPTTFLINNKGEIVKSFEGGRSKEDFMSEINKMMKL